MDSHKLKDFQLEARYYDSFLIISHSIALLKLNREENIAEFRILRMKSYITKVYLKLKAFHITSKLTLLKQ